MLQNAVTSDLFTLQIFTFTCVAVLTLNFASKIHEGMPFVSKFQSLNGEFFFKIVWLT